MSEIVTETAKSVESDVKPTDSLKQTASKEGTNHKSSTDKFEQLEKKLTHQKIELRNTSINYSKDNPNEKKPKENIKQVKEQQNIVPKKTDTESETASPISLELSERSHQVSPFTPPSLGTSSISSSAQVPSIVPNPRSMSMTVPNATNAQMIPYGPYPVRTHCPECNADCLTQIRHKRGSVLYQTSACICCCTSFCGCCCLGMIPCLLHDFYDVSHECRNCRALLGEYRRQC